MTRRTGNVWARLAIAALSAGLLLYFAWQAGLLYTDSAPFHQRYREASEEQNRVVLRRMTFALVGAPLALSGLIAALAGGRILERPRRWVRVFGLLLILASFQSCGVFASLPYGFGSEYSHASDLQHAHMALANRVGVAALVGGILMLFLAFVLPVRRDTKATV